LSEGLVLKIIMYVFIVLLSWMIQCDQFPVPDYVLQGRAPATLPPPKNCFDLIYEFIAVPSKRVRETIKSNIHTMFSKAFVKDEVMSFDEAEFLKIKNEYGLMALEKEQFYAIVPETLEEKLAYLEVLFEREGSFYQSNLISQALLQDNPKKSKKLKKILSQFDFTALHDQYELDDLFSKLYKITHGLHLISAEVENSLASDRLMTFFSKRMQIAIASKNLLEREQFIMLNSDLGILTQKKFSVMRILKHPLFSTFTTLLSDVVSLSLGYVPPLIPHASILKLSLEELEFVVTHGLVEGYHHLSQTRKFLTHVDMNYQLFQTYFTPMIIIVFIYQVYSEQQHMLKQNGQSIVAEFENRLGDSALRAEQNKKEIDDLKTIMLAQLKAKYEEIYGLGPSDEIIQGWKSKLDHK